MTRMNQTRARRPASGLVPGMLLLAAAALASAGCASSGPEGNPIARKFVWLSYLNGEDLRPACRAGAPDRYRMVFNADYNRHVRTYDVTGDPGNGGATLEAHVIEATDIARVDLADPLGGGRGRSAKTRLTAEQFARFVMRLDASGAFDPMPGGLRLPSSGIYWLASGCRGGRWFFTAYPYPSDRYADIRFVDPLRESDGTGVGFPTLPAPGEAPVAAPMTRERGDGVYFEVEVDADGLVGPTHLFGPWSLAGVTPAPR